MAWGQLMMVSLLVTCAVSDSSEETETTSAAASGDHQTLDAKLQENSTSSVTHKHIPQPRQDTEPMEVPVGRKKVKIKLKKKHKKLLMTMAMTGILIKSALLPLAVGALKILTAKAFMITMMALGLALAITYRSAKEKHVTTEIINLVPNHGKQRSVEDSDPTTSFMAMLDYVRDRLHGLEPFNHT